jgi:hypothetical protein
MSYDNTNSGMLARNKAAPQKAASFDQLDDDIPAW